MTVIIAEEVCRMPNIVPISDANIYAHFKPTSIARNYARACTVSSAWCFSETVTKIVFTTFRKTGPFFLKSSLKTHGGFIAAKLV